MVSAAHAKIALAAAVTVAVCSSLRRAQTGAAVEINKATKPAAGRWKLGGEVRWNMRSWLPDLPSTRRRITYSYIFTFTVSCV